MKEADKSVGVWCRDMGGGNRGWCRRVLFVWRRPLRVFSVAVVVCVAYVSACLAVGILFSACGLAGNAVVLLGIAWVVTCGLFLYTLVLRRRYQGRREEPQEVETAGGGEGGDDGDGAVFYETEPDAPPEGRRDPKLDEADGRMGWLLVHEAGAFRWMSVFSALVVCVLGVQCVRWAMPLVGTPGCPIQARGVMFAQGVLGITASLVVAVYLCFVFDPRLGRVNT